MRQFITGSVMFVNSTIVYLQSPVYLGQVWVDGFRETHRKSQKLSPLERMV